MHSSLSRSLVFPPLSGTSEVRIPSGFLKLYGTEDQCFDARYRWRWPNGFQCPRCGHDRGSQLTNRCKDTERLANGYRVRRFERA